MGEVHWTGDTYVRNTSKYVRYVSKDLTLPPNVTSTHWSHTRNSLAMALKVVLWKGLREDISNLVFCPDGINFYESISDVLTEVVEAGVDVFGAWAKLRKASEFEGTGVVLECFAVNLGNVCDDSETLFTNFLNEKHDGEDVVEGLRKRDVFGFSHG